MTQYQDSLELDGEAIAALGTEIKALGGAVADGLEKIRGEHKSAICNLEAEIAKLKRPGAEGKAGEPTVQLKAFDGYLRKGIERLGPDEVKALSVSNDTEGGYLAPPEFMTELLRNIRLFSPVRQVARVMTTSAPEVKLPKRLTGMTAAWVGEKQDRPETTVTFGQNSYPVREIAAFVDVTNALLEDSAFDIPALLAFEFSEEFGVKEGTAFVLGTGVLDPMGFLNDASIPYTASGDATGFAASAPADVLFSLYHVIKAPYRANAIWAMNSTTMATIAKWKDGNGNYLLNMAGIGNATQTTLLGKPVIEMPDMPDLGAGAFPIIFGDFMRGYMVFDRLAISILRDPYSQATKGMTRFHGRRRVASGVGKAEALRKLKIAVS